ncbi:hypothetical protein ATCC90586_008915 [Pythium insidiosum]|nr:hypothetical protein ATCC90586_008915 [Pythium insidiosum]
MAAMPTVAVVGGLYALVLQHFNRYAPEPYMDEIFHVPQAQRYCAGRFDEWDPKITTFPGLYVAAVALARVARALVPSTEDPDAFCSTALLRSMNVIFAIGNTVLLFRLRAALVPNDRNAMLHALMIIMFPVLFFFSFLFYTDMGATFYVLLMYYLALPDSNDGTHRPSPIRLVPSAMAGALAVLFRQTNIVWVVFVAGTVVVRIVEQTNGYEIYGRPS